LYYQYKLIWLSENKICLIVRGEYDSSSRGHPVLPSSQGTLAPGQGVSLGTGGPFPAKLVEQRVHELDANVLIGNEYSKMKKQTG
jgi:hypothetical protein